MIGLTRTGKLLLLLTLVFAVTLIVYPRLGQTLGQSQQIGHYLRLVLAAALQEVDAQSDDSVLGTCVQAEDTRRILLRAVTE